MLGPCLPQGAQWHGQPPLSLFSLQAVRWMRMKAGRADRQISGSTSVGLALMASCLHMEVGKHLQREPEPHWHLRWFLTLNPNGISSENLQYCRQVGGLFFFFFHFEFLSAARGGITQVLRMSLFSLALSCKLKKFEEL